VPRYRQAGLPHSAALRGYPDQVNIHPESSHLFLFPSYRQKEMMIKKERKKKKMEAKRKKTEHTYALSNIYIFLRIYISICTISR
jgi:hypothetical protein